MYLSPPIVLQTQRLAQTTPNPSKRNAMQADTNVVLQTKGLGGKAQSQC